MSFTSGTQALQGRAVNHDPMPWYVPRTGLMAAYRTIAPERYAIWSPRAEFAVLDNPILADFRRLMAGIIPTGPDVASPAEARWWLDLLSNSDPAGRARSGFDYPYTEDQLDHAIRVLTKLAALTKEES